MTKSTQNQSPKKPHGDNTQRSGSSSGSELAGMVTDHLIIGGGIAGLTLANKLAETQKVVVIIKGKLIDNNSYYAQGGIASVLSQEDSFEDHLKDTLRAGAGLCRRDVVADVVQAGPEAIAHLLQQGVEFTTRDEADGELHLTREGGHSYRRVVHAKDITGRVVMEALIASAQNNPNILIKDEHFAVDLVTTERHAPDFERNRCLGAYILDRTTNVIHLVRSGRTYLCTGGHGKVYLYTSNPDSATGDGLAMGWRAGCRVANLEFMQFHPTCLYSPAAKNFLISEAVRGEGGILRNLKGEAFMAQHHKLADLAPRDIVARAIDHELKKSGAQHVWLDVTHLPKEQVLEHFPNIASTCSKFGIDITKQPIPVVPAAHYSCGGIVVDRSGRTAVSGLYALGEVACTGLHGANRLASNSLLEALVYADKVAAAQNEETLSGYDGYIPEWDSGDSIPPDEQVVLSHIWDEIRRLMWNYVGIVRTDKRLERAESRIKAIRSELNNYYWNYQITDSLLEVRNLAEVAHLTIRCAWTRKESRGIHYNLDHPHTVKDHPRDTVIW